MDMELTSLLIYTYSTFKNPFGADSANHSVAGVFAPTAE
jgi:hypothetical protein